MGVKLGCFTRNLHPRTAGLPHASVMVIDARAAKIEKAEPGGLVSGHGVKLAVLRAGQTYSLK